MRVFHCCNEHCVPARSVKADTEGHRHVQKSRSPAAKGHHPDPHHGSDDRNPANKNQTYGNPYGAWIGFEVWILDCQSVYTRLAVTVRYARNARTYGSRGLIAMIRNMPPDQAVQYIFSPNRLLNHKSLRQGKCAITAVLMKARQTFFFNDPFVILIAYVTCHSHPLRAAR